MMLHTNSTNVDEGKMCLRILVAYNDFTVQRAERRSEDGQSLNISVVSVHHPSATSTSQQVTTAHA